MRKIGSKLPKNQTKEKSKSGNNIFSRIWSYLKGLKPLLLSHHPNCKEFENHTFRIGKNRFCIGCFIGYPVAVSSVIILYFFLKYYDIAQSILFWIGVILMGSILLSPLKLTKNKSIKIIQKILFNIGGAFVFWWTLRLTEVFFINILIFFILFSILFTLVNSYHAYGLYKTCRDCNYQLRWEECPGFEEIFQYCEENNLPNLFKNIAMSEKESRKHYE